MNERPEQKVLHLDADAFFASVEQAADPRLRGRPVAVGGSRRGVVASASYEARRMGVYTTMPTARARKLCPHLVVVAGDFEKYERFSRFLFSYAYDFTPTVEVASIDEGYADLTGNRKKSAREIAETIRRAVRQTLRITLSEGIGSNKLVSAVASKLRKPDALIEVPSGTEREFLAPLGAKWLPGVGPKLAETLRRAGLAEIGHVAETSPEQLALFAGSGARTLWEMARGIDPRPVIPDPPAPKSFGEQETFEKDTTDEDFARARLRRMADHLLGKLRGESRTARTVEVRIRYNDFDEARRSESFAEPTDLESDVYPVIDRLLRRAWERRVALRLVGLKLSGLYGAVFQDTLDFWQLSAEGVSGARVCEEPARGRRHDLALTVDSIRERHGAASILRGHDLFLNKMGRGDKPRPVPSPRASYRIDVQTAGLNMKSSFSFLASLLSPGAVVRLAAERGCRAVALTDPNLHGAVEFFMAAKEAGIRAILGAEVWVGGRKQLAYVKNKVGYANLCAWLSQEDGSTENGANLKAAGDAAKAAKMSEGVRKPAGCRRSQGVTSGDAAFPTGGLVLVEPDAFPEVRYADAGEKPMFNILQSIRTLTLLDARSTGRMKGEFHFRPAEGDAEESARRVLDACDFSFDLGGLNFPHYVPSDGSSAHEFLVRLAREGLLRRYGAGASRHEAQLREELQIIAEVGYEEYFLLVWDILQDCQREGISWITRGSAADSLVCYCLGISDVCPIRYELYFKRFLNRDRMALNKLPDIDVDFAHDRKDRVVDLIFEKYGDRAAVVGGFSTYRGRSAFADIAKVFGVSESQIRRYTEHLPHTSAARVMEAAAGTRECADLDFGEDPYSTALALAARLDGFPRHAKMHPCGIVLSRKPVVSMCPLFTSAKGHPTTQFDMDAVEAIGLVKMDILAQGGLAVMRDALADIARKPWGPKPPPGFIQASSFNDANSFNDSDVWKMIASGGARGVHHIESPAMTSLNRMVNVGKIDDLIAIVSVIRPGAANTMRKVSFARRAQGLEPIEYVHPSLEPVLRSTYGVVAYEEHILQICEAFAGMPAGRADILRRALVKNQMQKVEIFREEFAGHARRAGRTPAETTRVWNLLTGFQGYAFCRAHSTAYGIEAYQAAWIKYHHPAEFLAAVLTHGKGFYDRFTYSIECRRLGIGFLGPDVNLSGDVYVVDRIWKMEDGRSEMGISCQPRIRVPLWQVKGLSDALIVRCHTGRPFSSMRDFVLRARPSTADMDALTKTGAFDGFGGDRVAQFWEARRLMIGNADTPLFQWGGDTTPPGPPGTVRPEKTSRLRDEMELLGFPVSGHPLEMFPRIAWDTYCPIAGLMQHAGRRVTVAGLIIADRSHHQSDGRPMKFLSLCDPTGIIECELFARAYARFGTETIRHPVIEIEATVNPFDNGNGCTLAVRSVRKAREDFSQRKVWDLAGKDGAADLH